jgi:DNA polymerase I-like protein with 3'-5' exonuclease and polymerase domains
LDMLEARPHASMVYDFERALQAPYLEVMLRGFRVDEHRRREAIGQLEQRITKLRNQLMMLTNAVLQPHQKPFDDALPRSSTSQLPRLFYEVLRLPEQWTSKKGVRKLSMDRTALEKLYDTYLYARPFISHILAIRDLSKQHEVLSHDIDPDGRFRSSYNVAGTESGRPSSSENAFGTGGNAQNIAPGLRYIFVADPGYKLCVIDFEQSEARDLGFLIGCIFGDWTFLDTCESGDLHTNVAKLVWPEMRWPGDPRGDRALADSNFYRQFSYRDMAKRGAHLSDYMGTAWTMARHLKITQQVAEDFQDRFCRGHNAAFPCIPRYWEWVSNEIQTNYRLITPFGRERHFFGDTSADTTLREGIAYIPQSTTSDRTNLGFWKTWKELRDRAQLLAQGYDSITFQALDDGRFHDTIRGVMELIRHSMTDPKSGRVFEVPSEAKIGYNWGNYSKDNSRGLRKWTP